MYSLGTVRANKQQMLAHFSMRLNLVSIDFLRLRWNKSRLNQGWSEAYLWDTVSRSITGTLRSDEVVDTRSVKTQSFRVLTYVIY